MSTCAKCRQTFTPCDCAARWEQMARQFRYRGVGWLGIEGNRVIIDDEMREESRRARRHMRATIRDDHDRYECARYCSLSCDQADVVVGVDLYPAAPSAGGDGDMGGAG